MSHCLHLHTLTMSDTGITNMPNLPNSLKVLRIKRNNIGTLGKTLPSTLTELLVQNCNLTELPPLPDTLKTLHVSFNRISHIELPESLESGRLNYNKLIIIPRFPLTIKRLETDFGKYVRYGMNRYYEPDKTTHLKEIRFKQVYMALKIQYWYLFWLKKRHQQKWEYVCHELEHRPYGRGGNHGPGIAGIKFLQTLVQQRNDNDNTQ